MLLCHFNFGWPLVDEGTDIIWQGRWLPREETLSKIFTKQNSYKKCPAPLSDHTGNGEEVVNIDIKAGDAGCCTCGFHNANIGLVVSLRFKKEQLPWLINWQHWGKNEYVTGLEPSTNQLIGQAKARERKELIFLEPGETRNYDLEIEVTEDRRQTTD